MDTQSNFQQETIGAISLDQSIIERFQDVAKHCGNNLAIVSNDQSLTYKDLDLASDAIAIKLLSKGNTDSKQVAILAHPEINTIVACLGVLKSGKAYVILDPTYPIDYQKFLLNDSLAKQILADEENYEIGKKISSLDPIVFSIFDQPSIILPSVPIKPDSNSYILYTSGSTGKPKGVIQTHKLVLHNVMNYSNGLTLTIQDRWTQLFSSCYGEAMNDIFCALLNGSELHTYSLSIRGLHLLADWIDRNKITIVHTVPTVFRRLMTMEPIVNSKFSCVRILCLGGEMVCLDDMKLFKKNFSNTCTLVNSYGSTETKLISQSFFKASDNLPAERISGGNPVNGKQVTIVDKFGNDLGTGKVGEIQVSSKFLARYWRWQELEDASFVLHRDGTRTYRTADLGWLSDSGLLYHLGRNDNVVKVRGYRLDIAEVEIALLNIPEVTEAIVIVLNEKRLEKILLACISLRNTELSIQQVRSQLKQKLPHYMIPERFLVLNSFPLTRTGKTDRKRLAELAEKNIIDQSDSREKSFTIKSPIIRRWRKLFKHKSGQLNTKNTTENNLIEIWCEILKRNRVGLEDNFFDIGGQSLTAVEMLHEVEKRIGASFPLSILIKHNTIKSLTKAIDGYIENNWQTPLQLLNKAGNKTPLFLVHAQSGNIMMYKELAKKFKDRSVYGIQSAFFKKNFQAPKSIEDLVAQYVKEIQKVQPVGPYLLGGRCLGGKLVLEVGQQLTAKGEIVSMLAIFDSGIGVVDSRSDSDRLENAKCNKSEHKASLKNRIYKTIKEGRFLKVTGNYLKIIIWTSNRMYLLRSILRKYFGTLNYRIKRAEIFHRRLYSNYQVRTYKGTVVLYRSSQFNSMERKRKQIERWGAVAKSGLTVVVLPGDHMTMLQEPCVSALAKDMQTKIQFSS